MEGGDTCAMSLQCCTRKIDSQIKATSMEPSLLLMFPTEYMERWLDQYKTWRQFILDSYQRLLKQLETRGEIKLSRNKIILLKF
jgi:CRP/FNR family transcriptional regulator